MYLCLCIYIYKTMKPTLFSDQKQQVEIFFHGIYKHMLLHYFLMGVEKLSSYISDYCRIFRWTQCIWRRNKPKERVITKCLTIQGFPCHFKPIIPSVLIYVPIAVTLNSEIPVELQPNEDMLGIYTEKSMICFCWTRTGRLINSVAICLIRFPYIVTQETSRFRMPPFVFFCQILLGDFHTLKMAVSRINFQH